MKITKVTPYSINTTGWRNFNYIRIDTDEGLHGIGEAFCVGPDKAWVETVKYFESWLVGRDPLQRERLQQYLVNISRFPGGLMLGAAISAIDLCLWDITGKAAGLPVYKLIGQVRDKVPTYTHLHAGDFKSGAPSDPQAALDMALAKKEKCGYHAAKVMLGEVGYWPTGNSEKVLDKVMQTLREGLGDDFEIGVEMMTRTYNPIQGLRYCKVIEPYRPMFAEEVIRPERIEDMAMIQSRVNFPIATGEQLPGLVDFERLIRLNAANILQPEILFVGGMTTMRKIAALAEPSHKVLMPHNCLSPLHNCINLHFCMCTPNAVMLENEPVTEGPASDLVTVKLKHDKDGYLKPTEEPGWGLDLNWEYLAQLPPKVWARNSIDAPNASYLDGSAHPL